MNLGTRRLARIDGEQVASLSLQLSRIESKLEVQSERYTNKLEEHGHRIGSLDDRDRDLALRLHDQELSNARQQSELDRLREEAREARRVAETKGNRSVGVWSAAIAGVALFLTVAQQLYIR